MLPGTSVTLSTSSRRGNFPAFAGDANAVAGVLQSGRTDAVCRPIAVGAVISLSVRRVKLAMSQARSNQHELIGTFHALGAAAR